MSRYFFHIRDGLEFVPDEEGVECRDLFAAWEEALCSAGDIALSDYKRGLLGPAVTIEIEDEEGNVVAAFMPKKLLH